MLTYPASAQYDMEDQIQTSIQKYLEKDVELMSLAFQPRDHRSFWSQRPPEVKFQGVV